MTAGFGRLLYTDCAPGSGRGGGAGFQVQAQSPEVTGKWVALATGWLLYEVQNAWLAEQRPVGEFPPGFAHVADGGYGTGQSRYVGKEVMGGRQGNHLADCLVTGDPELYGTIRPAQLYGSSFWRADPWPATDCQDFDGDLEPGPLLTLDALTTWVRERTERGPVLGRLVSVLEDPDGLRVVIVSPDTDEAMRWLACATLLLPQRQALDLTFKVFSANPLRAQQRVVAAPPDLNPQIKPGLVPGVFILDAGACQADDAPVSDRAAFLAGKLAGDQETDPFDLLDTLELAGELSGSGHLVKHAALHAAWALTRPDEPIEDPEQVQDWLKAAQAEQLAEYGSALAEMMLAANQTSASTLRWLDEAVTGGRLELDQAAVRSRLLTAELNDAAGRPGQPVPAERLPLVPLSDKAMRDAESELTSALLHGGRDGERIDAGRFDRVLRLAYRHRIDLPLAPLKERLHLFAAAWVDDQKSQWGPQGRALSEHVLDETYSVLHERFTEPLTERLTQTLARFLGVFDDRDDLADPVYCHLQAASIASLTGAGRLARLDVSLGKISRLPEVAEAARVFQGALVAWHADDADVALTVLAQLPSHIDPRIGRRANAFLAGAQAKPSTELLDMLANLYGNGWQPPSDRLNELLDGELRVREFLAAAARANIFSRQHFNSAIELIAAADATVVDLRADEVLDALLTTKSERLMGSFFAFFPPTKTGRGRRNPIQKLITLTGERMASSTEAEAAGIAVRLVTALASPRLQQKPFDRRWNSLAELVQHYDGKLSNKDSKKWRAEVRARLAPDSRELRQWDGLFAADSTRSGGMFNLRKSES